MKIKESQGKSHVVTSANVTFFIQKQHTQETKKKNDF